MVPDEQARDDDGDRPGGVDDVGQGVAAHDQGQREQDFDLVVVDLLEQVVGDHQLRMAHGDGGPFLAAPPRQPTVLRRQIRLFAPGRGPGGLRERGFEPAIAVGGAAPATLARALVVARTHPRPRTQVPGAGETAHVGADLGKQVLRRAHERRFSSP